VSPPHDNTVAGGHGNKHKGGTHEKARIEQRAREQSAATNCTSLSPEPHKTYENDD